MGKSNNIYLDLSKDGISSNMESWQSNVSPIYVEREGIGGRRLITNQSDKRIYFRIDKSAVPTQSGCFMRIEVRYFDEGVGHFSVVYNTENGIISTEPVLLENTCKWRTAVIYLENALLNRGIIAYDFALELYTKKYGASACHVIFGSLSVTDIAAEPAEISVSADSLAGYTFFEREKIKFNVKVKSTVEKKSDCKLTVIFRNRAEEILQTKEFDVLHDGNDSEIEIAPDIDKYGCYSMTLECSDGAGEIFSAKRVKFALSMNASESKNDLLGTCVHFTYRDSRAVSPLIAACGISSIRDEFLWKDYEKEKGKFEFLSEWERYLGDAETNGLNMFTILGFNNPLYHEGSNCIPKNDEIKSFEKYTKQLVNFLGERCGIYEVWNEPNLWGFSSDISPETYIAFLEPISKVIRNENPNAYIAAPGLSGEALPWVEKFLQMGGGEYIDAISFHPYLWVKGPDDGEFIGKLNSVNELIKKYCPKLEMIISEMGWASNTADITRKDQAQYHVKAYAMATAFDNLKQYFVYEYQDSGSSISDPERNFGLVEYWESETPYAAKPLFTATAAYNYLTQNKRPKCLLNDCNTYIFSYEHEDDTVLMMWSVNPIKINCDDLKITAVYDINGNEINGVSVLTSEPIYVKADKETIKTLTERIINPEVDKE